MFTVKMAACPLQDHCSSSILEIKIFPSNSSSGSINHYCHRSHNSNPQLQSSSRKYNRVSSRLASSLSCSPSMETHCRIQMPWSRRFTRTARPTSASYSTAPSSATTQGSPTSRPPVSSSCSNASAKPARRKASRST